eukprot:SAG25_NODE_1722_length_2448_cov_97.187279_5_plen_76_part_01
MCASCGPRTLVHLLCAVLSRTVQAGLATVRTRMEDLEAAAAASDGEEEEEGGAAGAEQLARLSQKLNELGPTPHHR